MVVDGEDDGSGALAEQAGARVFYCGGPKGPAVARNVGAREARGDVLLFIDADVVPHPPLVDQVKSAFLDDSGLSALIGSYDDAPGAGSFLSQYRNLLHHYTHQTAETEAKTFWGACGAVRRGVFEAVGGFDENYAIPAMEDMELGYRMSDAGYRIALLKHIQVKHLKHWGLVNMLRTDIFQRALPWTRLLARRENIPGDLNLRAASRWSAVFAWLLTFVLCLSMFVPEALFFAVLAAILLICLNRGFYLFLAGLKGWFFMLRAIPWHWLYFLYGSAAFAYVKIFERASTKTSETSL